MQINKFKLKVRVKSLTVLLFVLIIPTIINSPLFGILSENTNIDEKDNFEEPNLIPKLNAPPNAHYFSYYKPITIDYNKVVGSGSYTDFPVLISILDSDLRFDVQSNGNDIGFSYEDTWLDHEIELFDQTYSPTQAKLVAWVRIPTLSGSIDTVIRMYYGNSTMPSQQNPTGVWNSDYVAVWHMNQDPSSSNILDSTSNNNDLNTAGFVSDQRIFDGKVGTAITFDGVNDFLGISPFSGPTNGFTFESWFKFDAEYSVGSNDMYLFSGNTPSWGNNMPRLRFRSSNGDGVGSVATALDDSDSCYTTKAVWAANTWFHYVFRFSVPIQTTTLYLDGTVDGIKVDGDLSVPHSDWNRLSIGSDNGADVWGSGAISEFRVLSVPLSEGWINTEYQNQYYPDSFYSIGSEQSQVWEPFNDQYFTYYKIITIDNNKVYGTGGHVNFPILISILDEDLRYHVQPDGDDIAFTAEGEWLDHEIELFNQAYSSTQAQLIAWIRIPFLSSSANTTIAMYYGNSTMASRQNPTGVWDSSFKAVWHLSEDPSGGAPQMLDSTTNDNDGTSAGSMTSGDQVEGQIDGSLEFDGTGDYVNVGSSSSLDNIEAKTVSAWVQLADNGDANVIAVKGSEGPQTGWHLFYDSYVDRRRLGFLQGWSGETAEWHTADGTMDVNTMYHVAVTYNRGSTANNPVLYIDGVSMAVTERTSPSGTIGDDGALDCYIARYGPVALFGEGIIDEVRISAIIRSADWIATEYSNQNDPDSFYTVGEEQLVNENPPNYQYFNYYKELTIDHTQVSGLNSHLNFPLLISHLDNDLRFDVQNDGDDIAFAMDGKWLDHQIELFNQTYNSSTAQLISWVRIPFLSTGKNTTIRMYYGNSSIGSQQNPADVWDSGYVGVWHLNDDPSSQINDSSSPFSNGVSSGFMASSNLVKGAIGEALDFDGFDDYIYFLNTPELQITGAITVQAWFKGDYIGNDYLFNKMADSGNRGWDLSFDEENATHGWVMFRYSPDGTNIEVVGYELVRIDSWHHIVGVFEPNQFAKFFLNGTLVDIDTTAIPNSLFDPPYNIRIAERADGSTNYDGVVDEARISNIARSDEWIATEYNNQYDPTMFYSVGKENFSKPAVYLEVQVNAIDLYGNSIPNVLISMYNGIQLIARKITDLNGVVRFTEIIEGSYNFTATISSNIGNFTELVNSTIQDIVIDQGFQIIDLICNVSRNIFEIVDIDGVPLESGWILVGNGTDTLQNCLINTTGHATFWWVNTTPYYYNYTIYYQNLMYNPSIINLTSGDINTPNYTKQIQVNITTIEFTVRSYDAPFTLISGAKLKLRNNSTGDSIVNLTTDLNGRATFRWLNSSGIDGNYSLQIEFFGENRLFNDTLGTYPDVKIFNFTVRNKDSMELRALINTDNFQTGLNSLNPTDYISVKWGTQLKLRILFNITLAVGHPQLLGPTYADSMNYQVLLGGNPIQSGSFTQEEGNDGRHYTTINTKEIESDKSYVIIVSAKKSGFTLPSDLILQLNILENEMVLNQSENDDSTLTTYWLDNVNMTLNSYGTDSESFTIENAIFQSITHEFNFSIPDIENRWNLSTIIFNLYNITWNVAGPSDINITIEDPYGTVYKFNSTTHGGWDYNQGTWKGLSLDLNQASLTMNNSFEFKIGGTFSNSIDIIADAYCIRDIIEVQYSKFNISNSVSIFTEIEGWAIKNITFVIFNCYNTSTWTSVDLSAPESLNITTNDGFRYSLDYGDVNGNGIIIIDDRIINPLLNEFLFSVETAPDVIFDAIIKISYIQEFYKNQFFETINFTKADPDINNNGTIQINVDDANWGDNDAILWITGIKDQSNYYLPSEIGMNITIGGQLYNVSDYSTGTGMFSLVGFTKDQILHAIINTSVPVNFSLDVSLSYSRKVFYNTLGSISYVFIEAPTVYGDVQFDTNLGYYLQTIDTSLIDVKDYTVRFTITKNYYASTTKDLTLSVLNRPTLLNNSMGYFKIFDQMYAIEAVNYTFTYADNLTYQSITDLSEQSYIWERYDSQGVVIETDQGSLISTPDNNYVLDLNTEYLVVGEYFIIVTLYKSNYDYKIGLIQLTINERPTTLNGSDPFTPTAFNINLGDSLNFTFTYFDVLTNSSITNLDTQSYNYTSNTVSDPIGSGVLGYDSSNKVYYLINFTTISKPNGTYTIIVSFEKENYTTQIATLLLTITYIVIDYTSYLILLTSNPLNLNTDVYWRDVVSVSFNFFTQYQSGQKNLTTPDSLFGQFRDIDKILIGNPINLLSYSTGAGNYTFTFNTSKYSLIGGNYYDLKITADLSGYTVPDPLNIPFQVRVLPVELEVFNYTTTTKFPDYTISKYWDITFNLTVKLTEVNTGLPITDASMSFSWEFGSGDILPDIVKGAGYYSFSFDTVNSTDIGAYTINFLAIKQNYSVGTPSPNFIINVIEKPTELNSNIDVLYLSQKLYLKDSHNFTFEYIDILTSQVIANAEEINYILQRLDINGNPIQEETILGTLYETVDHKYLLDLNTKTLRDGEYSIIISIKKKNYDLRVSLISLIINKREFEVLLSIDQVVKIASGGALEFQISLFDPNNNSIPVIEANIYATLQGETYYFEDEGNGNYSIYISNLANTFFSSKTLIVSVFIEKDNFTSESYSITAVVPMEEIFPGIPTFYFVLVLSSVLAFIGIVGGYKLYKHATIPEFVKKARGIRKAISKEKGISESLLYRSKEVFIGELVKHKWDKIGLSLADILGVKIEKELSQRRITEDPKKRDFTPTGLLLMKWDERVGTEILTKYPDDLYISEKTLMQIYGAHEHSGEKGIVTLSSGAINILSYYTGPENSYYLLLYLNQDDDPDIYEGGMADIVRIILERFEDDSYLEMFPSLFQRLSVYPSLSDEEIIAVSFQDEVKRMIITILRDGGIITKSELSLWIKDKFLEGFMDLDAILVDLAKKEVIKQISVKGISSELIILNNDPFMLRVPPVKLIDNPSNRGLPSQFVKTYKSEVKTYFQDYHPSEEDNLKIINILIDPEVYETLRLLRTAIVTRQELEKLRIRGVKDISGVLQLLLDRQMIKIFRDQNNNEYFALLTDFYIDIIFPKYILNVIKTVYEQKSKPNKALMEFLKSLEETYFSMKKQEKSKK